MGGSFNLRLPADSNKSVGLFDGRGDPLLKTKVEILYKIVHNPNLELWSYFHYLGLWLLYDWDLCYIA